MCSREETVRRRVQPRPTRGAYLVPIGCAVVIVAIATILLLGYQNTSGWASAITKVGGYRKFVLADGSIVQLNTNTELLFRLTADRRELVLTRGEARFKVAHDPARPFVVQAQETVVRAVGTEFNVRVRDTSNVDVSVIEGVVSVSHHAQRTMMLQAFGLPVADVSGGTRLSAGNAAHDAAGRVTIMPRSDVETRFQDGWLRGRLLFKGDMLADVVLELNRYNAQQMHIVDDSIERIRIGGSYTRGDDIHTFLKSLASIAPVETREISGRDTHVTEYEIYRAHREVIPSPPSEQPGADAGHRRY